MASDAVDQGWRSSSIDLDRGRMAVAMAVEVDAMTGLAISAGELARGAAGKQTGAGTVARLTSEMCRAGLHPGHIRGGAGGMTVYAKCYRRHGMGMTMTTEVSAVTSRATRIVRLADGATDQKTGGGTVAGLTTEFFVGFFAGAAYIWGSRGIMAVDTDCHRRHGMTMDMAIKISGDMAGLAGTAANRHRRGIGGRRN